jgi:hypothetical protein
MRILLTSSLLLTCLNFVSGQNPVILAEKIRYGVYFSFDEFHSNSPSVTAEFKPVYRGDYYGYPPTRLKIKTPEGKFELLDQPAWGYFDSTRFYVNRLGFNKLEQFGRYCVFEGLKQSLPEWKVIDKDINMIDAKVKYRDYIIDIYTGRCVEASKSYILEILKDDPELYAEFKKNGKKEDVYSYVERYNRKHPITYPITYPTGLTE